MILTNQTTQFNDNISIFATILVLSFLFIFLPLIIFLRILHNRKYTPEAIGARGEYEVAAMLETVQEKYGGYIINNVIVPNGNSYAQIDHIYFSTKGIFVIETKNYAGGLYGAVNEPYWTQVNRNIRRRIYNPLMQNETHVNAIRKLTYFYAPIYSMVIFVQGSIERFCSPKAFTLWSAKYYIESCYDVMNIKQMDEIYNIIIKYKNNPIMSNEDYARFVREKHNYR